MKLTAKWDDLSYDKVVIMRRKGSGLSTIRRIIEYMKNRPCILLQREGKNKVTTKIVKAFIRWGAAASIKVDSGINLNTREAILQSGNKAKTRIMMQENNIPCPRTYFNGQGHSDLKGKVIVRPMRHSKGQDVMVYQSIQDLRAAKKKPEWMEYNPTYVSEVVDKVKEYRLYFFEGRITSVTEKLPREGVNPQMVTVWNHETGMFKFENVKWKSWPLFLMDDALKLIELSKLDFGAVDVMVKEDESYFFLELNSAIQLESPYRAELFAMILDDIINRGNVEEFEFIEKKKPSYIQYIHPAIRKRSKEKKDGE